MIRRLRTAALALCALVACSPAFAGISERGIIGAGGDAVISVGPTASRPKPSASVSAFYFDQTLGKLIYWNAAHWYDLTGTQVADYVPPVVTPLAISGTPGDSTVGASPTFTPAISGGTAPYTLSVSAGALPSGRSISGLAVTGAYTAAGSYSYTLRATDAASATADLAVTVNVTAPAQTAGQMRNVAMGSALPNQPVGTSGSSTAFKGTRSYKIGADFDTLTVPWANTYISNTSPFEVAGPADETLTKVAVRYNGVTVPVTYASARGATLAAGTSSKVLSDGIPASAWGVAKIPKGATVQVCWSGSMASAGGVASTPFYNATEQLYRFDPANTVDDVDTCGTGGVLAAPTGAVTVNIPSPVGVFGRVLSAAGQPTVMPVSLVALGDSIADQSNDFFGDGAAGSTSAGTTGSGGGWIARAAYQAGVPYLKMTLSGHKADNWYQGHAWRDTWIQYGTHFLSELGVNDSLSSNNVMVRLRTISQTAFNNGAQWIGQSTITPKTANDTAASPWNANTTLAGEVASTGTGDGTTLPTNFTLLNASIRSEKGGSYKLTDYIDVETIAGDASNRRLWPVPSPQFSTTLAAAMTAGAMSSFQTVAAPTVGMGLSIDPGNSSQQGIKVSAVSGTGPYTVTIYPAMTAGSLAHASGATVLETNSLDGTHLVPKAHMAVAAGALPQFQAWTASQ